MRWGEYVADVVAEAARWLDDHWPADQLGPWHQAIDWKSLSMLSPCRCIAGQLGACLASREGYALKEIDAWGETGIILRAGVQHPTDGYEMLIYEAPDLPSADDTQYEQYEEAWHELRDRIARRLGIEVQEGHPLIPAQLETAFAGIPGAYWKDEALKRGTLP